MNIVSTMRSLVTNFVTGRSTSADSSQNFYKQTVDDDIKAILSDKTLSIPDKASKFVTAAKKLALSEGKSLTNVVEALVREYSSYFQNNPNCVSVKKNSPKNTQPLCDDVYGSVRCVEVQCVDVNGNYVPNQGARAFSSLVRFGTPNITEADKYIEALTKDADQESLSCALYVAENMVASNPPLLANSTEADIGSESYRELFGCTSVNSLQQSICFRIATEQIANPLNPQNPIPDNNGGRATTFERHKYEIIFSSIGGLLFLGAFSFCLARKFGYCSASNKAVFKKHLRSMKSNVREVQNLTKKYSLIKSQNSEAINEPFLQDIDKAEKIIIKQSKVQKLLKKAETASKCLNSLNLSAEERTELKDELKTYEKCNKILEGLQAAMKLIGSPMQAGNVTSENEEEKQLELSVNAPTI